jgi:hypothetical protein
MVPFIGKSTGDKKAKRRLYNIQPSRVDIVSAAANQHTFLVCKAKESSMAEKGPRVTEVPDDLASTIAGLSSQVQEIQKALEKGDGSLSESGVQDKPKSEVALKLEEVAKATNALAEEVGAGEPPADLDAKLDTLIAPLGELQSVQKYSYNSQANNLREIGGVFFDLVCKMEDGFTLNEAVEQVQGQVGTVTDLLAKLDVAKSSDAVELSDALTSEDSSVANQAFLQVVKELCYEAGALSWQLPAELDDEAKKRLSVFAATIETLCAKVPTRAQKAASDIVGSLKAVSERADYLAKCAEEGSYDDAAAMQKLVETRESLAALNEKYAQVQKSADFAVGDLSTVLNASNLLNTFEAGLYRLGILQMAKEEDTADNKQETGEGHDGGSPDGTAELKAQVAALSEQVANLVKSFSGKPGKVPAPACTETSDEANGVDENSAFPPAPGNYNDPAYVAKLKGRGLR